MMVMSKQNSLRTQLFTMLCASVISVIIVLIIANSLFTEFIYRNLKVKNAKLMCERINRYYNNQQLVDIKDEFEKIRIKNDEEILIKDEQDEIVYSNYKGIKYSIDKMKQIGNEKILYRDSKFLIHSYKIPKLSNFILIEYKLDNGFNMYIRISTILIHETIAVVNSFLGIIGLVLAGLYAIIAFIVSRRMSNPIQQMINVTSDMKRLEFEKKYRVTGYDGDINKLGNNINQISEKFEKTIRQLRNNNNELEKDIEEQTRIDEMRQQFISDVSHELKTPISLIEGYAEGLIENVNEDEESRKFYAEVILDESKKMDKLVGELLELMKYEYKEIKLNDEKINIDDIIEEEIRRERIILDNKKIDVEYNPTKFIISADKKCTEQVVGNYLTNAIKHCEKVNKEKKIVIRTEIVDNKVRLFVYNTGKRIQEEYKDKIWSRFFKIDSSRNRKNGGTGIGLAMVKAIMQNYDNEYGYRNFDDGVEFYCDFNLDKNQINKE